MTGSEAFGNPKYETSAWGIKFDTLDFNKVKIESGDGTSYKIINDKKDVFGKLAHQPFFEKPIYDTYVVGGKQVKVMKSDKIVYNYGAKVSI